MTLASRLVLFCAALIVPAGVALVGQGGPPTTGPVAPPAAGPGVGRGGDVGADFLKRPPVTRQPPELQQQMFVLPPGYQAELVLADPTIEDPVGVSFDGNGRMYVLEMRSYMRDADGSNSREPISRISRHEDTDGDGVYDRHTVFADGLVMPRTAFPLDDGAVLVLETDQRDLYKYSDTNGDGRSDKKELFYAGYGRVTNMEWQPGGIAWALDNWMYTSYNPFRIRIGAGGKVLREETDVNGGQWGANQDNYGKVWFVDGGTGLGPVNFQAPIVYGAFNVPDNFEPDFQEVWGVPGGIADMQGGMGAVRMPDGTLNRFTAAAGPEVFRGDRLPADLVGDLLFTEPVGRMVRRAKVVVTEGLTQLRNAYPKAEFIRSTDPLFRPVNLANAPDGTVYLVDMYTGIIQDAQFVGPGSYLRRKVEQYQLDRQHNCGRIWRITYTGMTPNRTPPRMYGESAAELVARLESPSGWWRDTAQKLLVLRRDLTVVPRLKTMVRSSSTQLGRIHALWTLEGLGSLDAALAREVLKDADPEIRIQAIRASETLYKAGDRSFAADYRALTTDADPRVVIQAMLTLNLHRVPQYAQTIRATREAATARGVRIGGQILSPQASRGQPASNDPNAGYLNLAPEDRKTLIAGEQTYRELCFSCHGSEGQGMRLGGRDDGPLLAPPLAGSARVQGHRDYVLKVLLNGLTGPVNGVEYNGGAVMVSMATNTDEWIADVANYVRNAFGNSGRPLITPEQVAVVRRATAGRRGPWTLATLEPTLPTPLTPDATWTFAASHNSEGAANLIGQPASRWDSGAAQQPGMWFQIGLPQSAIITEIQLDAAAPTGRSGGGLGGFGGLGVAQTGSPPATGRGQAVARAGGPPAPGGRAAGAGPVGRAGGGGRGRGAAGPPAGGPAQYVLQTSMDGTTWSAPVATGSGATPTTVVAFAPTVTRFLRITQTGTSASDLWAIQQLRVYRAGTAAPR